MWLRFFLRLLLSMAVSGGASTIAAKEPSAASQRAYLEWAATFDTDRLPRLRRDDPKYLALFQLPDADLVFLQAVGRQDKPPLRQLANEGLAKLKTDRSFAILSRRLGDPQMLVRENHLRPLGQFGESRCVAPLLAILEGDPLAQLRRQAAQHLGNYDDPGVREALLERLKTDGDSVAVAAANSLAALREKRAIPEARRLVGRVVDPRMRLAAVDALAAFQDKQVIPMLLAILGSELEKVSDDFRENRVRHCQKTGSDTVTEPDTVTVSENRVRHCDRA